MDNQTIYSLELIYWAEVDMYINMAASSNTKSLSELLTVIRKALDLYPKTAVEVENRKKERVSRSASEFSIDDINSSFKKEGLLQGEL